MSFSQLRFDHYARELSLAIYDLSLESRETAPFHELMRDLRRVVNPHQEDRMSVYELKQALVGVPGADKLTMSYDDNGNQVIKIDGKTLEVGSHDEILTALRVGTKERSMKLQGLAAKMALLRHNLEAEAEKLGSRVDGAATKSTETFAKSHQFLDSTDKDLADVEKFIAELDAATNGGPTLEDPK